MDEIIEGRFSCKDGVELAYSSCGDGFPLILVNGLGNLKEGWLETTRSFARYFRVIGYDYRNQGREVAGHGTGYPTRQHAEDLDCLVQNLGLDTFVGIGISTGARILTDYAELHPSKVDSLVLMGIAPPTLSRRNLVIFQSWLNALESSTEEDFTPYVQTYMPWIYGPEFLARSTPPVHRIAQGLSQSMTRAGMAANIGATMESLRRCLAPDYLDPPISSPTVVLQGEYDLMAPPKLLSHFDAKFPNGTLTAILRAGHNVRGENREEFERLALDFLLNQRAL
jgi:pimeloyl-ACP methyl ester carboxylesterase